MTGLLDKLNVLVKSSLNTFLGGTAGASGPPKVPAERLGKDIDAEVARLRQQIDGALTQEDAMQKRLEQVQQEIGSYDQQADAALQRGDETNARYLIQQMQRQQQPAMMMQAELDQHRRATSEFIERVNVLEAMVSDARRQPAPDVTSTDVVEAQADQAPGASLSELLRDARERVENSLDKTARSAPPSAAASLPDQAQHISSTLQPKDAVDQPQAAQQPNQQGNQQIDDDLAKRRARLSKPN